MIDRDTMLDWAQRPEIRDLDLSSFGEGDVVNLILQRSEIIFDQPRPGRAITAWSEGDPAPLRAMVDHCGEDLMRRAAGIIAAEYAELSPVIAPIAPRAVADIGCGYAIFDLFLWRDHQCRLLLIDIETSDARHFGYRDTGAAYSDLKTAKKFLTKNGVAARDITLCNPQKQDLSRQKPVDLALSFLSCGFHYPIDTYLPFFQSHLRPKGGVIVDFRARKSREGQAILGQMGAVQVVTRAAQGNADRVLMRLE